jgi:N-carbamoyl-L-amino-acid hydrolase
MVQTRATLLNGHLDSKLNSDLTIDCDRLLDRIQSLAQIGALPGGGVCRLAYSDADLQGRTQVAQWMQDAGMTVRIDAAGNLIGRYPGEQDTLPVLATGSHLDTVPSGGKYDGAYGVLAGLEVVQTLHDAGQRLRHPLEVIAFTDEEGSMIGSKAIAGSVKADPDYYRHPDGTPITDCLERLGGNWMDIHQAQRSRADMAAFVELHVEQGPVLEAQQQPIGIVEGIVGQRRFAITVEGQSSHAGTTPMTMRRDALVAAAQVVLAVNHIGCLDAGQQVATVGKLQVFPNAANVIPHRIEMSLDIRDLFSDRIDQLLAMLHTQCDTIAQSTQTTIQFEPILHNHPAPMTPHIQTAIAQVCEALDLSYTHLPSRASHDAQELSLVTDVGMIFVPSQNGISHDQTEYTSPIDCIQGANVLLRTLLLLDQQYDQESGC